MPKKTVDTRDLALRIRRGQIKLADVPEQHRSSVRYHLYGAGEAKLNEHMRRSTPPSDRASQRIHQRFVTG